MNKKPQYRLLSGHRMHRARNHPSSASGNNSTTHGTGLKIITALAIIIWKNAALRHI